jgi:hypothetical protein
MRTNTHSTQKGLAVPLSALLVKFDAVFSTDESGTAIAALDHAQRAALKVLHSMGMPPTPVAGVTGTARYIQLGNRTPIT